MNRLGAASAVHLAAGTWLLIDLWRAWTPTLITIFGQAATTPPELIGAFAFGCVLVPVLLVAVARRLGREGTFAAAALVVALVGRFALQLTEGGHLHLVVASVAGIAAMTWLSLALPRHRDAAVTGVVAGLAVSVTTHAALGTWGAVWRDDVWASLLLAAQLAACLATLHTPSEGRGVGRRFALTVMPGLFLAGVIVANAGRASATLGDAGLAAVAFGATLAVAATLVPVTRVTAAVAAVVLVGAVAASALVTDADGLLPAWTVVAFVVGMPALAHLWRAADRGDRGTSMTLALGGLVWVALLFAYYAGYDLGYRADWLLVGVALVMGVVAATAPPAPVMTATPRTLAAIGVTALAAGVVAAAAPALTIRPFDTSELRDDEVRVAAYNLRMGYGMDGVFRPKAVAAILVSADVGLVSEIDRGWFLNGGQDQLAILERLTGRTAWWGAAADPVWGDAVLVDANRARVERRALPSHGAVTGAQAIAVQPDGPWESTWFVSTHLQPVGSDEGVTAQSADLAAWLRELGGSMILGGDFNLQEGSAAYDNVIDVGLVDAAPGGADTSPADAPVKRIDYLFSTPDLVASDVEVPGLWASDHLPVVATFTRR
ncbi:MULTISPECIES: endonuclease/exonuclease/phosphatase family protein [Aeromicrobium]|uniref:endonuclease/exonuclease/phosphatase family protein n=1 Tax=Aeromicrobium TaxID=2040 RepID=UPI00257B3010|nr:MULTISPECIES: endonuclease/exonuclease/phosphatase family protein [Aeromicrobium]